MTKLSIPLSLIRSSAVYLSILLTIGQPASALNCRELLTQWKSHINQSIARHLINRADARARRTGAQTDWNSLTHKVANYLDNVDPNLQFKIIRGGTGAEFIRFFSSPDSTSELGKQITDILGRFSTNILFFPEQLRGASAHFSIFGKHTELNLSLTSILNPYLLPGTFFHERVHFENYFGFISGTLREEPGTIEGFNRLYGYEKLFSLDEFEAHLAGFQVDAPRALSRYEKWILGEQIGFCLGYAKEVSGLLKTLQSRTYVSSNRTAQNGETIVTVNWTINVSGQTKPVLISLPFYRDTSKELDEQVQTVLQNKISTVDRAPIDIGNVSK